MPEIFPSPVTRQQALDPEVQADAPQKFVWCAHEVGWWFSVDCLWRYQPRTTTDQSFVQWSFPVVKAWVRVEAADEERTPCSVA